MPRTQKQRRSDPETKLLTRRALARVLKIHMQTVTKWEREGLPVAKRGRKGRASLYREVDVRAWLQAREETSQLVSIDVNAARARKEHWQACLAEQLHAMRARTLLKADDVERAWIAEIAGARALILASYVSAADRVFRAAVTDGLAGVERELKMLAHGVLEQLKHGNRRDHAA